MKKRIAVMLTVLVFLLVSLMVVMVGCGNTDEESQSSEESYEINFSTVYAMAVEAGYTGTMEDLIAAFKGDSAYALAKAYGYTGTEEEWLASLRGAAGANGADGITPTIGANKHWFIGSLDTGVVAEGKDGNPGANGVGIERVDKTTVNNVDTYTITYTDGNTYEFSVTNGTNGVGIEKIEKTGKNGLIDIYTITFTNGSTYDFTIVNGKDSDPTAYTGNDYFRFTLLGDDTYEVKARYQDMPVNVIIPSTYNDKPVTAIAANAFDGRDSIDKIVIPNSITSIGTNAFKNCVAEIEWGDDPEITEIGASAFANYLGTEITIPNSVASIGDYAFADSELRTVTVMGTPASVGEDIFDSCPIDKAVLPFSLLSFITADVTDLTITSGDIGASAFAGFTNLTSLAFGGGVSNIHANAFSGYALKKVAIPASLIGKLPLTGLEDVIVSEGIIGYQAFKDCTAPITITIGRGVTRVDVDAFNGCTAAIAWDNPAFTMIEPRAFQGYKGASLLIPDSITNIDNYAFVDCTATIIWGDHPSVTSFAIYTFDGYKGTSLTIPDSVTSMPLATFANCSIKTVTLQASQIGILALYGLDHVIISNGEIGDEAFKSKPYNSLSTITIGNGVTSIGAEAFSGCAAAIEWGDAPTITSIGNDAFSGYVGTSNISIPNSVTSINEYAFRNCTAPIAWGNDPHVTEIVKWAFSYYQGATLTIPNSVTTIGAEAFKNCTSLTSITIPDSVTSVGTDAFKNCPITNATLPGAYIKSIPTNNVVTYTITSGTIPGDVFQDPEYNYQALETIYIGNGVTGIGSAAFHGCTAAVVWGDNPSITEFGDWAFSGYLGTSLEIPASVTTIGSGALNGLFNITSFVIPNTVTSIATDNAFVYCSFTSVSLPATFLGIIPNTATTLTITGGTIGAGAFARFSSLTSLTINSGVTSIDEKAFEDCPISEVTVHADVIGKLPSSGLTSIIVTEGEIEDNAFSIFTSQTSITIANGVSVDEDAFNGSTITTATVPASVIPYLPKTTVTTLTVTSGTIGARVFDDFTALTSLTIGSGVTSVSTNMITDKENYTLKNLTILGGFDNIPDYAFYIMRNLERLELGEGITRIGTRAFDTCVKLECVYLPVSLERIDVSAFGDCFSLTDIYYAGTEEQWATLSKQEVGDIWDHGCGAYVIHYAE